MKIKKFTFPSSNGTDTIAATMWIPKGKVRGILQIVHGMQEYMANYDRFARAVCERGFCVAGFDSIGHGNTAPSGRLGCYNDCDSSEFLVLDIRRMYEIVRKKYRKAPFFIYGHSFGSFQTRLYISRYRDVSGAIIAGTGEFSAHPMAQYLKILKVKIKNEGGDVRSELVQNIVFGKLVWKFLPMKNRCEWVTRDEGKIREYDEDEKSNFLFSLNGYYTLLSSVMKSDTDAAYENVPKEMPLFIISGSEDGVGDYGKGTKKVYDRFIESGHTKAEMKIFEGARHNLLHETNYEEVHGEIIGWLERNL